MNATQQMMLAANGDRSAFREIASNELDKFQRTIGAHVDAVRSKEMHPDKARGSLKLHAEKFRADLASAAKAYSSTPAFISGSLARSADRLALRREANYDVHKENGARIDSARIETEISNRAHHFRAKAIRLGLTPGDEPDATGLLKFLEKSASDPAATTWARRELQELAELPVDPATHSAIREALRDPTLVDDASVESYLTRLMSPSATPEGRAAFASEALQAGEPSAMAAVVVAAGKLPGEPWTVDVLKALDSDAIPENVVSALLADDRARRQDDQASALLFASVAADKAAQLATLEGVSLDAPPTPAMPGIDYTREGSGAPPSGPTPIRPATTTRAGEDRSHIRPTRVSP